MERMIRTNEASINNDNEFKINKETGILDSDGVMPDIFDGMI